MDTDRKVVPNTRTPLSSTLNDEIQRYQTALDEMDVYLQMRLKKLEQLSIAEKERIRLQELEKQKVKEKEKEELLKLRGDAESLDTPSITNITSMASAPTPATTKKTESDMEIVDEVTKSDPTAASTVESEATVTKSEEPGGDVTQAKSEEQGNDNTKANEDENENENGDNNGFDIPAGGFDSELDALLNSVDQSQAPDNSDIAGLFGDDFDFVLADS